MSQQSDLIQHFKKYGSITPLEALSLYGIFRLAARIYDLRDRYNIDTVTIESSNKKFAKYIWRGEG